MMLRLVIAVTVLLLLGYTAFHLRKAILEAVFLVVAWRFLTGHPLHGKAITDAGWVRSGTKALTPTGHASRWHHRPRWQRAAHRLGSVLAFFVLVAGFLLSPRLTIEMLAGCLVAALGWLCFLTVRSLRRRKERRTWLHPLHLAVCEKAGIARAERASSWISVKTGKDKSVKSVSLSMPPGWPADSKERDWLIATAAAKLGIEAPDTSASRWSGPSPVLVLSQSEPPPALVRYGDVEEAVDRAHSNELVCGIGKRDKVVTASLSLDSPHFGINMGTGGGKSNLAAFWLLQELRRGGIAMVLDSKWHSHPWLIKDDEGEHAQLPNIAYLSSPAELHAGMLWLGRELDRRNQVTRRAVTASGEMRGDVGPRIFIIAEELNQAMPKVRQHWNDIRRSEDPKSSPALAGFRDVAFAGRAVKMHMILIGQMLTAEVTGGGKDSAVRENVGVKAMARYGPAGWRAAVGSDVPMPPVPGVVGRIQLVTARGVHECQVPKLDLSMARRLATGGSVTLCPAGMPGAVTGNRLPALDAAPDQPVVTVTHSGVTLREAVDQGVVHRRTTYGALKMARHRDPDFPAETGTSGTAKLYDQSELAAWDRKRRS